MELEFGGVYEIISEAGDRYVVRIENEDNTKYHVMVLERGEDKIEYSGTINKQSRLLETGKITRLDTMIEATPTNGFSNRKKKFSKNSLTKDEILIESLIKHVQSQVTKEHIMRAIDEALDAGNRNLFMVLSNQLNELEGVTA